MITHRRWDALDKADLAWLRARYHFQVQPDAQQGHVPLGPLIVWNDDEIAPGAGFPLHGHRDVEIITYIRQGTLGHRDSLGSEGLLQAGDVQVMSAGTGIRHTEFNRGEVPLRVYQIWLLPREKGGVPRWDSRTFPSRERSGRFTVLASGYANDQDAVPIRADARLLGATLKAGERLRQPLQAPYQAYLVVASGRIDIEGELMGPLDGAVITELAAINILALEETELVMVETG